MNSTQVFHAPAEMIGITRRRSWKNILVWTLQFLMAAYFLSTGFLKVTLPMQEISQSISWASMVPGITIPIIGVLEILCAIGLVLPAITKAVPRFTIMVAAVLMTVKMAFAIIMNLSIHEYVGMPTMVVLFLLTAAIAFSRWKMVPLAPKAPSVA